MRISSLILFREHVKNAFLTQKNKIIYNKNLMLLITTFTASFDKLELVRKMREPSPIRVGAASQWWSNERMMVNWVYDHILISPTLTSISPSLTSSSPSLTSILHSLAWSKPSFAHLTFSFSLVINTRRYFALVDTFKPCSSGLNERRTTFLQSTGDYLVINN